MKIGHAAHVAGAQDHGAQDERPAKGVARRQSLGALAVGGPDDVGDGGHPTNSAKSSKEIGG